MIKRLVLIGAIGWMAVGQVANATILTVFDGIAAGRANFDAAVANAGGTVSVDTWVGLMDGASIDRGDYVITQNDGGVGYVTTYGTMSGQVIGINPAGGGSNPRTNPLDYFGSGITFTFKNPVNSVGFEVGDWSTCCTNPTTDLYISFDGGTPIQVASATTDTTFPSQDPTVPYNVYEIFVAAFDDTGDFKAVSFWGNGIGEYLVAGGQLRYALLKKGSLPGGCGDYLNSEIGAGKCIENGSATADAADQVVTGTLDVRDAGGAIDTNGFDSVYEGVIFSSTGGAGGLVKTGLGSATLAAQNTYTGLTVVDQGALIVNGSIAGPVNVNPNGTLRGTGVINGVGQIGGRLAPGRSPGTLTFNAPVTMLAGSVLQIDVDGTGTGTGAGNYSRLIVQGAASTFAAAGDFQPILRDITGDATNTYTPAIGQLFTPVSTAGGVIGTFDSLTQPAGRAPGTRFDLLYNPYDVQLVVTPARYAALPNYTLSGNAVAVGGALDLARPAAHAQKEGLYRSLALLNEGQLATVIPQLAGEIHADMIAASFDVHRVARGVVFGRLQDLRLGRTTPGVGEAAALPSEGTGRDRYLWVQATGQNVGTDGDSHGRGFDTDLYGVAGGIDFAVTPEVYLGLGIGYGHGHVDASWQGDGDASTTQLFGYGLWERGQWFANFALGYGWDSYETDRVVELSPASSLSSDADGDSTFLDLEGGMRTQIRGFDIEPTVGLRSDMVHRDSFTEAGTGGLTVRGDSWSAVQTRVGAKVSRNWEIGDGRILTPELRLYWLHDFGDAIASESTAALVGQPFTVQAADAGRDALAVGLGVRMAAAKSVALYLDYDYTYRHSANAHSLVGGVQVSW